MSKSERRKSFNDIMSQFSKANIKLDVREIQRKLGLFPSPPTLSLQNRLSPIPEGHEGFDLPGHSRRSSDSALMWQPPCDSAFKRLEHQREETGLPVSSTNSSTDSEVNDNSQFGFNPGPSGQKTIF